VGSETNPYRAPASGNAANKLRQVPLEEVPSPAPLGTIVATRQGSNDGTTWRIAMGQDELWIVPPDGTPAFALTHLEFAEHTELVMFGSLAALVLRGLAKPISLKLPEGAFDALRTWMARMRRLHVSKALKKRLRYSLPLGLFVALTALPFLAGSWDVFALVFGVGLIGLSVVAPFWPHPGLFALDAVLWLSLATGNGLSVLRGESRWAIAFLVVQLMLATGALRLFGFYRRIPAEES
jgi:hypothetical protein